MSWTILIGLGATAWALIAGLLTLVVARMTRMRDLQRPRSAMPSSGVEIGAAHAVEWIIWRPRRGWERRPDLAPDADPVPTLG